MSEKNFKKYLKKCPLGHVEYIFMKFAEKFSNNVQNIFAQFPKEIQTWSIFQIFNSYKTSLRHVEFIFDSPADVFAQFRKKFGSKSEIQLEKFDLFQKIHWKPNLDLQMGYLKTMLMFFCPLKKNLLRDRKSIVLTVCPRSFFV